jgi:hypothetical protein
MEMPESCDTCFLSKWDTCNERFYCMFDDCPLVEVPAPHGRLIDADALLEDVRKNSVSYSADDFAHEWVDVQPTVIEAEETE